MRSKNMLLSDAVSTQCHYLLMSIALMLLLLIETFIKKCHFFTVEYTCVYLYLFIFS